ncbi:FadR/GntR family transcriptional regulator [Kitasatospora sp. NPDC058170]|uniref:FadR/GntR family transcriptional regulator n=1 Tax=Kitasatospora sp. NPDC058170 TaxID=3346364 RepID=UPI0036D97A01
MLKVGSSSRVEQIAEAVLEEIASGRWGVGDRIPPEPALMERLGVARNTMREAVRALAHAGVLEIRHGDGVYVRARTDTEGILRRRFGAVDLGEILAARRALEVEAARAAAVRRTPEDLDRLAEAWHRLHGDGAGDGDGDGDGEADRVAAGVAFHRAVVEASHNVVLIELYQGLASAVAESLRRSNALGDVPEPPVHLHRGLYEAIRSGDPDRAAAEAARPLDAVIDALGALGAAAAAAKATRQA